MKGLGWKGWHRVLGQYMSIFHLKFILKIKRKNPIMSKVSGDWRRNKKKCGSFWVYFFRDHIAFGRTSCSQTVFVTGSQKTHENEVVEITTDFYSQDGRIPRKKAFSKWNTKESKPNKFRPLWNCFLVAAWSVTQFFSILTLSILHSRLTSKDFQIRRPLLNSIA